MKADYLRKTFLDFFKDKRHRVVESDSLVPKNDPTVLFTPAGMNQFKRQFLGEEIEFRRAATCQRCLRTDDLDKVGKTSGHHTFFEMLGNFSFGDYFKREAISWAWEFLTEELKIPAQKLWVSVYKDDDEAYNIWNQVIKMPRERIVRLADKENFWPSEAKEKGPNGPCGPCSEIFFDWGAEVGCKKAECNPACSCGRFVEIWNLVFTQYNRKDGGILEPLPQKNIDTGMGLERLTAIMEGVANNFETELFLPLIKEIHSNAKINSLNLKEISYAIADHIRAVTFAIYDGVLPSNEGRGYVVRKILRKSGLHLHSLGIDKPFLYRLVPVVTQIMRQAYPDLVHHREDISQLVLSEEKLFLHILDSSPSIMAEKFAVLFKRPDPELAGRIAFQLYDTYGIPLEFSQQWLSSQNLTFSQDAFDKEFALQKERSKIKSQMKGAVFEHKVLKLKLPPTKFTGYENYEEKSKVLEVVTQEDGSQIVILDKTPFYPEGGGQKGDVGIISRGKNIFEVKDTQRDGRVILHIGRFTQGNFKKSALVLSRVDKGVRLATARNHTATHLLQAALRKVLGDHVRQQGSLVTCEKLRFDFTHFKDISDSVLNRIEELVNLWVMQNIPLEVKKMPLAVARRCGALAFFAEKYEKQVRVVAVGDLSKELCGGTHLKSTGEVGLFRIIRETSTASGVRRIEAITGEAAIKSCQQQKDIFKQVCGILNVPAERLIEEIQKRLSMIKELEKELANKNSENIDSLVDGALKDAEVLQNGIRLITKTIPGADANLLRRAVDLIKTSSASCVVVLAGPQKDKVILVSGVTVDLVERGVDAKVLLTEAARLLGGSGGGRKDFAQAGGSNVQKLKEAFLTIKEMISKVL